MRIHAIVVTIFLVLHHSVALIHGGVHNELNILLTPTQDLFVNVVLVLLPIIAVVLVWTRFASIGLFVLMLCMASSLVFDVYYHYIFISPDNIAHLPHGTTEQHSRFRGTADALALLQVVGAVVAAYLLGRQWHFQAAPNRNAVSGT